MNHSDLVNIILWVIGALWFVVASTFAWLLKHASRLSVVESQVIDVKQNQAAMEKRADARHLEMMGAIRDLSNKIDNKANRNEH